MGKKRLVAITNDKNRVILSEVLPYETPVIFSNRYFYKFLVKNGIFLTTKLRWKSLHIRPGFYHIIDLLLSAKIDITNLCADIYQEKDFTYNGLRKKPFTFKIAHKLSDYRALSIPHPLNQLNIIKFYDENKEIIQYVSSLSRFSIRHPHKVARNKFVNDYLHSIKFDKESTSYKHIELDGVEAESIKSFFTYKHYSNIHKFFESTEYQDSEKKYNKLYKFDISKFFDSIYTHSIAWALLNKEIVKDNIKTSSDTFAGKFDKLMQEMNYGETNGILIGPEVSRIFAEILLQAIDKAVFIALSNEDVTNELHYKLYRYVDDYFLFYDDDKYKNRILDCFKHKLKEYGLYISESKSMQYAKPIITDLTIAKVKITDLLDDELSIEFSEDGWKAGFNFGKVITRFKIVVKESKIEYKDVINYSLAVIEKRALKVLSTFSKTEEKQKYSKIVLNYLLSTLELSFFIYSVAPRVSSTIKMVSLLSKILQFIKLSTNDEIKKYQKESIYTKIYNEICNILTKNKMHKYTQNENIYLLIVLAELGRGYRLSPEDLETYFTSSSFSELNYFTLTALLFYMKDIKRYDVFRAKLVDGIDDKFKLANKDNLKKDTELVLLLMDLLTCPYINIKFKKHLLSSYHGINNEVDQYNIINFNKYWFIKWTNFNLVEEIEMKKGQEVYG